MTEPVESIISRIAGTQRGLVTRAQLLEAGATARQVERRIRNGRLRHVHRGVYSTGVVVVPGAPELAAVLACGREAYVSHGNAAPLWDVLPPAREGRPLEVTVVGRDVGQRPGIRPHRVECLDPDETAELDGIPLTSPARTLLDLAGSGLGARVLERAVARAERENLITRGGLAEIVARRPSHRGARVLAAILQLDGGPAYTRSEAESRFLELVRQVELSPPETNVVLEGYEVDFLWPRSRVIVEIDGFAFHGSRRMFDSDRSRDLALKAAGYEVLRLTWRDLTRDVRKTLFRLGRVMGSRP